MKILLTGATGYVGSAVGWQLLDGGHQVTGVARHSGKEGALAARGLRFERADLTNTALLAQLAREHDAVVHAGMASAADAGQIDARAVDALITGLASGRGRKVFLYTSGVWVLGRRSDEPADETSSTAPHPHVAYRSAVERRVRDANGGALRTQVIRPGIVYGGKEGILAMWWGSALRDHHVRVVGEGENRWPLVHREDLARLYQLVLERGAPGAVYHGTEGTAHRVIDLARAVGKVAGADVQLWPLEAARAQMGTFADALVLDQVVISPASERLSWTLQHPDFLKEVDRVYREFVAAPPQP